MSARKLLLILAVASHLFAAAPSFPFCFSEAAKEYNLAPELLYAIGQHESGLNPAAVNWNSNGTYDFGPMQINSSWAPTLAKAGIPWGSLADPCTNVKVGAWILAQCFQKYGQTWQAVGCYNSQTPAKRAKYARSIAQVYQQVARQRRPEIATQDPQIIMTSATPKVIWNDQTTLWDQLVDNAVTR